MSSQKWTEDTLKLSKKRYIRKRVNSISLEEQVRLLALGCWHKKPLLPEEWVVVRMRP